MLKGKWYRKFTSTEVLGRNASRAELGKRPVRDRCGDNGMPLGYREIAASVYTNGRDLVICGDPLELWPWQPGDDHPHNCDAMACGQEHVIARTVLVPRATFDDRKS